MHFECKWFPTNTKSNLPSSKGIVVVQKGAQHEEVNWTQGWSGRERCCGYFLGSRS
jgi:hypothetical protein